MPIRPKKDAHQVAKINPEHSKTGSMYKAALYRVRPDGSVYDSDHNNIGIFLLNPSTWEESKGSNWVATQVPGQSDPVLQWLSSGPRTISFEALITKDTAAQSEFRNITEPKKTESKVTWSDVGGAFFKVTPVTIDTQKSWVDAAKPLNVFGTGLKDTELSGNNYLSISEQLNYFRSLLYPIYDDNNSPKTLQTSPPLVVLYVGDTFSKKNPDVERLTPSDDVWVVTNLRIRVTKQLPNLSPMEASVEFHLLQYNIRSSGAKKFYEDPPPGIKL